jgi:uncharacterized lipoprotein YmbA
MKTTRGARTAAVRHRLAATALYALIVAEGGCASSPPSRFYQLRAVSHPAPQEMSSGPGRLIVGIGPVRVPGYLDRPQIVTSSGNQIDVADFDRWAGSIEDDIALVLVENLSARLPAERFFITRWPAPHLSLSCRIEVRVERFEGPRQGPVSLRAQWYAFAPDGRLLLNRSSSISAPVTGGGDYGALVEAMSRALDDLSRGIAEDVTSLPALQAAQQPR